MVRWFLSLAATLGVCLSAMLPASPVTAAEKGKWWQSVKSGSSNGASNGSANGFSVPSKGKKLTTPGQFNVGGGSSNSSAWKKLQGMQGIGSNTGGANTLNTNGLTLGKQHTGPLKLKQPIDFGQFANGGQVLNGPARGNVGGFRPNLPAFDRNKITDAIKNGNFQPINGIGGLAGAGGGNAAGNGAGGAGGGGNAMGPPAWLPDHLDEIGGRGGLVEDLLDGIDIGPEVFNPPGDAADPGQGGDDQADPNPGDENPGGGDPADGGNGDPDMPHDDDDDHHDHPFPWWPPIVIGGGGGYCPPSSHITVIEQPFTVVPAMVDLQLLDVRLVDAGDPARNLGPRYRLVFGNAGTVAAGNFRVLAMASHDGTPSPTAPTGTAEVVSLAAGMVASADVRLPLAAELPSLGALVVAIDSAMQIVETDEQNNVAVLDRGATAAVDSTAAMP